MCFTAIFIDLAMTRCTEPNFAWGECLLMLRVNRLKGAPFCGAQYPEGPLAPKIDIIFTAVHVWSCAHEHGTYRRTHTDKKNVSTSIYRVM